VDLHQVDDRAFQQLGRALHLRDALAATADPHFGREKDLIARAEFADYVADHSLAAAIHRRGIDHCAATRDEPVHDLAQRPARRIARADIEHRPGAEPDHRHRLTGRWDRPRDHRHW